MRSIIFSVAALALLGSVGHRLGGLPGGGCRGGGVAGHVAGHHGLLGAAAGCAVGHHMSKKKMK